MKSYFWSGSKHFGSVRTNLDLQKDKAKDICDNYVPHPCVEINDELSWLFTMAIRVVEFSNGGYKIRKIFA